MWSRRRWDGRWAGEVDGGRGGLLRGAIVCSVEWSIVSWASDSSFCLFKHHQHRLDHWDNKSGESHIKIILKSWLAAKFTINTAVTTFKCQPRPRKTFKKICPDTRSLLLILRGKPIFWYFHSDQATVAKNWHNTTNVAGPIKIQNRTTQAQIFCFFFLFRAFSV